VADGIAYISETSEKFDLILVDGPDRMGVGEAGSSLYTPEFYRHCARLLKLGGMLVIQSDVPYYTPAIHTAAFQLPPYIETIAGRPLAEAL